MKYFHISAEFKLNQEPLWLRNFRKKFDVPYTYHVTLKNPTEIKDRDVARLKKELESIISSSNIRSEKIELLFNNLKFNCTSSGECIMVMSEQDKSLAELQAAIRKGLSKYGMHIKPEYDSFEKNFDPHLTIGRHLSEQRFQLAKQLLDKKIELKGALERIALTIVDEPTDDKWTDLGNKTFFELSANI